MSDVGKTQDPYLFRLWVRRGNPFAIQPPHNPAVEHDGGTTVAHLVMTGEQAAELAQLIREHGCTVDMDRTATQTAEQAEERQALLGVSRHDTVWPSASCPECAWFDPVAKDNPCGRATWNPSVTQAMLEAHEKARTDEQQCPVPHVWG